LSNSDFYVALKLRGLLIVNSDVNEFRDSDVLFNLSVSGDYTTLEILPPVHDLPGRQ